MQYFPHPVPVRSAFPGVTVSTTFIAHSNTITSASTFIAIGAFINITTTTPTTTTNIAVTTTTSSSFRLFCFCFQEMVPTTQYVPFSPPTHAHSHVPTPTHPPTHPHTHAR
ncbi:hypothetical protein E2C01_099075 [Portunus trituberculatus]|uniref:Uncharacterized protein n=1 Tax=Portunus trituberculatus TaxID=210409 RepID=A0A5B7K9C8_PORTR|nr:hypothetical protein [Portunus trituberculatus]